MKKMKKIVEGKLFWLVVSFLISFSVWVYVTSVETVESTKVFRNIPVEIVGEETLLNMHNLVITGLEAPTVTVEIRGPRRIVNALDSTDLIAQVDVSRLSQPAYTTLNYTLVYPSGVDTRNLTVRKYQDSVSFYVSMMTTISVPVGGDYLGEVSGDYIKATAIYEPSYITVSGPEVYVRNVDHAYVEYGSPDMTLESTFSEERTYTLMDKDNNPCSTEYLTCTPDLVRVTLPVLAQKEVPLTVVLQDAPDANTENTRITIEPRTLKLAGDSATLENINQIQLDIIDLSKIGTEYTAKYTIPIPVGVRNRSGITEATVTIEILGVETKSLEIDQFEWLGVSDDVEVIVETEKLPVLLRGASKYMNTLNAGAVYAEADLSNLMGSLGNHFVTVQIRIPGNSRVGAIQIDGLPDYTVAIQLKQKEANS